MANFPNLHLALTINDCTIHAYPGTDATFKYIHFYPSANFALHISIPADFRFLADILILNIFINGNSASTFHVRPGMEDKVLEGIIRSPALVFPPDPLGHGQIMAQISHARVENHSKGEGPNELHDAAAQRSDMQFESVIDAASQSSSALVVTPLVYPDQRTHTFRWSFRSVDALRQVVPCPRLQQGPGGTEGDDFHQQLQSISVEEDGQADGRDEDEATICRLLADERIADDEEERFDPESSEEENVDDGIESGVESDGIEETVEADESEASNVVAC